MYRRNKSGRKFEPEAPYMKELCTRGDTCLHFGASDGRHSYLLSKIVGPAGTVHAFEPSKYSYGIMCRLIRWHKLGNVHPHNYAIGAEDGETVLNVPRKTSGHLGRAYAVIGDSARGSEELLAKANDTEFERQKAPVITLDSIVAKLRLKTLDFVRCDIEGAEGLMIDGGETTIREFLPTFLIEIHPFSLQHNFGRDPGYILAYFLQLGYVAWRLSDDDSELIRVTELDTKRRWRDYFLVHPSRALTLPGGQFRTDLTSD
ncbi:FkbM family methyltransferase [Hyphomonas sp. GM-8P]|uniref:FkbM family methyltransferase n=1 Tax=Hyphomonas sp. GM-8P TaxID=1280945 RepID=UPI0013147BD6|nr:FkbM family methyltransferase [Hyphomonas sp. GM-8P]|tara:strand:- start:467 stop:1246 length:780 start_codon:yes stop_codon:yes gene_type:complete